MQSLNDAARLAAGNYPGGLAALCVRMAWNYETARKEIAGAPGFKLGAERILHISELCIEAKSEHCFAIVNAFVGNHGGFVKLAVREMPQTSLMAATVGSVSASTDLLEKVTAARADGVISDNERKDVERSVHDSIERLQEVLSAVSHENGASKPLRAV